MFAALGAFLSSGVGKVATSIGSALFKRSAAKKEARANAGAGRLDLGYLREEALENGFNPSSVLRYTGGAGSTTPYQGVVPSFLSSVFSGAQDGFAAYQNAQERKEDRAADRRSQEIQDDLFIAQTAAFARPSGSNVVRASGGQVVSSPPSMRSAPSRVREFERDDGVKLDYKIDPETTDYQPRGRNLDEEVMINDVPRTFKVGFEWDELLSGAAMQIGGDLVDFWNDPYSSVQPLGGTPSRIMDSVDGFGRRVLDPIVDSVKPVVTPFFRHTTKRPVSPFRQ